MKKGNKRKGYSVESLRKLMRLWRLWKAFYVAIGAAFLNVAITKGNTKIGRVLNVSLMPIITCANCKVCHGYCYDIKACLQYLNVLKARVRNTVIYMFDPARYFDQIENAIRKARKNFYFRWHVSGDIPDYFYLCEMIRIARKYPNWTFWTYTKNYKLVNKWIAENGGTKAALPSNLSIMFSAWDGLEMVNPYGLPTFGVIDPGTPVPSGKFLCPGNCDICKATNGGCIAGVDTVNYLH